METYIIISFLLGIATVGTGIMSIYYMLTENGFVKISAVLMFLFMICSLYTGHAQLNQENITNTLPVISSVARYISIALIAGLLLLFAKTGFRNVVEFILSIILVIYITLYLYPLSQLINLC